jgi:hypothetical protein
MALTGYSTDASAFEIITETGVITLKAPADYEVKRNYSFDIIASDTTGNSVAQPVIVTVTNIEDEIAPILSSASTATVIENSAILTVIYDAQATDNGSEVDAGISYRLSGTDAGAFDIVAETGVITLKAPADYGAKSSYSIDVIATDESGNLATQAVTIRVIDVTSPIFSSADTATIVENSAISTVVYDAQATDNGGEVDAGISYRLSGTDASAFDIVVETGVVTLKAAADYEIKSSYSINVIATDTIGNTATKPVTVRVINIDDSLPVFSSTMVLIVAENTVISTAIFNVEATDNGGPVDGDITYSLSGTDSSSFDIVAETGLVTLNAALDYEVQSDYKIDVMATDRVGNTGYKTVVVNIANVEEILFGTQGNDVLDGFSSGYDFIDGKEGLDTVKYSVTSTEVLFNDNYAGQWVIQNTGNSSERDTLVFMERIQFSDTNYALDLDGNAGDAAKAIIATFGADDLSTYMPTVVSAVDLGYTLDGLCDLVIQMGLIESQSGSSDMSSFVEYVYGNVVARELNAFENAMIANIANDSYSKSDLLKLAVSTAGVESQVTDYGLVLDGNTGIAAKAIIATFGADDLSTYMPTVVSAVDLGYTLDGLCDLVIQMGLIEFQAGSSDMSSFVEYVYGNVVARELTAFEDAMIANIVSGPYTKSELLKLAGSTTGIESQVTSNAVDLIGVPGSADGELLAYLI